VNFPLLRGVYKKRFKIVVSGDTQTYSNDEVGYIRDTLVRELVAMPHPEAVIVEGDVMGDDLSLFPRFKQALSLAKAPQYYVPGNHDVDFDSPTNANSFDTFKREWGPTYYSFDIGDVHFIVLNDVRYPCTPEQDDQDGLHPESDEPQTNPIFNAVITEDQIQWLENDLAHVPMDRLIVFNMHVPMDSFILQNNARETVDKGLELTKALGCQQTGGARVRSSG
jgi:Calcineurin-like phosphoesterase